LIFLVFISSTVLSQDNIIGKYKGCYIKTNILKCDSELYLELKDDNTFKAIIDEYGSIDSVSGNWYITECDYIDSVFGNCVSSEFDSVLHLREYVKSEKFKLFLVRQDTLVKFDNYSKRNLLKVEEYRNLKPKIKIYSETRLKEYSLDSIGELYFSDNADSIFICFENNNLKIVPEKYDEPYFLRVPLQYERTFLHVRFIVNRNREIEYIRCFGPPIATNVKEKKKILKKVE